MRLKKADALIKAQENLEKRSKLVDKATEKYKLAMERLDKAKQALVPKVTFTKTEETDSSVTYNVNVEETVTQ